MEFQKLIRTLKIYNNFKKLYAGDKLGQAYLFVCPDKFTNNLLVQEIAKVLMCDNNVCDICPDCLKIDIGSHPDVLTYPKGESFLVSDSDSIVEQIYVKPMLKNKKVFILNNIDVSTVQAQNKLLKVIEEPPSNAIFLLTATKEEKVLNTIHSRVNKMYVDRLNASNLQLVLQSIDKEKVQIASYFGDGYIGKVLDISNNSDFYENYQFIKNFIEKFKKSEQIPFFSGYFAKNKAIFENCLFILNYLLRDILMSKLNKENLISSVEIVNSINILDNEYSITAITKILQCLNDYKKKLEANTSLIILADNLLFEILEVKYLCK